MRVLITRPIEDAEKLAALLRAKGDEPLIEPLLAIAEIGGPEIDLDGVQAILATSANGVRALAKRTPRRDIGVLAVGEGSGEAARAAGFKAVESAAGDVAALARLAKARLKPEGGALYHAAGAALAGDLKGLLETAGFTVRRDQLYEAAPIEMLPQAVIDRLAEGSLDAVMLFSPRTARVFSDLWRKAGMPQLRRSVALALSKAVADHIRDMDWARIAIARKPDLPSMLALVDAERERIKTMSDSPKETTSVESEPTAPEPSADAPSAAAAPSAPEVGQREELAEKAPVASSGGFGRFVGALVAGAIGGAAISLSAPYWLPLAGLAPPSGGGEDRLAQLQSQIAEKAASADLAAAAQKMTAEIESLKIELATARDQLAQQSAALQALSESGAGASAAQSGGAPAIDLAPVEDRIKKLEAALAEVSVLATRNAEAQAAPAQIAEAARQTLEAENRALRDRIEELSHKIEEAAALTTRVGEIETRLDQVPAETARQRAAALIVAVGQLQSALADDRAFYAPLRTVQDLAIADQAMWDRLQPMIDVLAPLAEAGVPTRSQLAAGFPGTDIARAAEADLAGALVEDAPWWKRLMHRVSEVVTVRPVGGDVEGDGPLERLARAEADLGEGDLAAAVEEVSGIGGTAKDVAGEWLAQARARIAVDEAASELAGFSARALEPAPGGAG